MTPTMLRQLWSLIENTHSQVLLRLDDTSLVHLLIKQLENRNHLDGREADILTDYLYSKISLIRDLAQQR